MEQEWRHITEEAHGLKTLVDRINLAALAAGFFCTATAAHASEDLLSLDSTLLVQLVIFLATIFILNALVFRPLLNLYQRRRQLTIGTVSEARELEERAAAMVEEYTMKLNEAKATVQAERDEIKRQTQEQVGEKLSSARAEAQKAIEEARGVLETDIAGIKEGLRPEIETIARDLASKILGRGVRV